MKSHHGLIIMSIWMAISLLMELLEKNALMWMALIIMIAAMVGTIILFIGEWNEKV